MPSVSHASWSFSCLAWTFKFTCREQHIYQETAICRNLPVPSFTGDIKNLTDYCLFIFNSFIIDLFICIVMHVEHFTDTN